MFKMATDQQNAVSTAAALFLMLVIGVIIVIFAFLAYVFSHRNARVLYFANGVQLCPSFVPIFEVGTKTLASPCGTKI
jgi:hypothetical protein